VRRALALVFAPLRAHVQRAADRRIFADRSDPYAALARLGRRLDSVTRADDLLGTAAADIRQGPAGPLRRRADEDLTADERRLIDDLARHLGVAAHVQPRRRSALRRRLEPQRSIQDVRRLVFDLRPPALDEIGLPGALDQHLRLLGASSGNPEVVLRCHGDLPPLPPAIEAAAYRLTCEAVTNALRHAGASTITVELRFADELVIEVSDDGRRLPELPSVGVGLRSMRDRAEELGGRLELASGPSRTVVTASLPVHRAGEEVLG
jgi:signal transduction histidine kinase